MQKSDNKVSIDARRRVQASTVLNRKNTERPVLRSPRKMDFQRSTKISRFGSDTLLNRKNNEVKATSPSIAQATAKKEEQEITPASVHPLQARAAQRMNHDVRQVNDAMTAKEIKDQEIKKALATAIKTEMEPVETKKISKLRFGAGRIILASLCAAVAVFAIVYFVNLNMPDMSLKVAAMQTGINAKYPNYVPRDFSVTDIASENNVITLNFRNPSTDTKFSITEEESSWDSNALLNNFVKNEYSNNYTTIKEQGLTIYIDNSNATWVNGGIIYKITTTSGSLTKKIITTIATSGWR